MRDVYKKFAPAISVLGGFNPAGHWKKVFVQEVKKPSGDFESFGKRYKSKIQFVVGCIIIPTAITSLLHFVRHLGEERSQNLTYVR